MNEIVKDIVSQEYTDRNIKDLVALEINVKMCIFDSCKFTNCNFSTINLMGSSFVNCEFVNSKILGIDWSVLNQTMGFDNIFRNCDLSYSVFLNNDLRGMELHNCKLKESSFEGCKMKKCVLKACDFELARFIRNDLRECDFTESINYVFDILDNQCEKAKFNSPEVLNLLRVRGLKIEDI